MHQIPVINSGKSHRSFGNICPMVEPTSSRRVLERTIKDEKENFFKEARLHAPIYRQFGPGHGFAADKKLDINDYTTVKPLKYERDIFEILQQ